MGGCGRVPSPPSPRGPTEPHRAHQASQRWEEEALSARGPESGQTTTRGPRTFQHKPGL